MNDDAFDQFVLFLSTEYFAHLWNNLSPVGFSVQHRGEIQSAARKEADDFLDGAEVLYDIDFSAERRVRTRKSFEKRLRLDAKDRTDLRRLETAFAVDPQEQKNVSFCCGLIYRVIGSAQLAHHLGLAPAIREGLTKAMEANRNRTLNTLSIEQAWLQANGSWDRRVRSLTPDVPEAIFLDFLGSYQTFTVLPALLESFGQLTGGQAASAGLLQLSEILQKQFPKNSSLDVPTAVRAYGQEAV